ncbi:hypothetical protein NESM_000807000 [Novymonas esmeraldas]|uniref:Uncharacterized protein n=1 Tax=Novymonas esmeraldas TaxID=1808958 RepID=A0AAW0EW27_9TRYP
MLSLTRCAARHRGRHRLPRSLRELPTPNIRRGWGQLASLDGAEREELLHGAWRESTPIHLVPERGSRDCDGAAEPIAFATDEGAARYLAEETKSEEAETRESTLALARRFFVDLATTAAEEVDVAQMPPAPQSDEERRREMRHVQCEFFGDFYVEQGIVEPSARYAFVDAMLRPSRSLFLVNSVLPLTRLTVRDQLEAHSDWATSTVAGRTAGTPAPLPIFSRTPFDPCVYAVPRPPTQAFGAALHIPFTAATTSLPAPPSSTAADGAPLLRGDVAAAAASDALPLQDTSTSLIGDADALEAMMLLEALPEIEGGTTLPARGVSDHESRSDDLLPTNGSSSICATAAAAPAAEDQRTQPPSLAHTFWLQRHIAYDALYNVDDVSLVVSLLGVRLAAATSPSTSCAAAAAAVDGASARTAMEAGGPQSHSVVLYQSAGVDAAVSAYHCEMAQYLHRAVAESEPGSAAARRLAQVVIAVEDASVPPLWQTRRQPEHRARRGGSGGSASRSGRGVAHPLAEPPCSRSDVPVLDRYPSVVYLAATRVPPPQQPQPHVRRQPLFSSRVVVCVPSTSQDGVRPRGWLASGDVDVDADVDGGDGGDAAVLRGGAPPNTFVQRCQQANANFSRLQRQLYAAVQAVGCGGGWVVYATQSINVLEDEAVVCAVLHRLHREADEQRPLVSATATAPSAGGGPRHVECVPLDSVVMAESVGAPDAVAVLRRLCESGRRGLSSWSAIEDGAAGQEPEQYSAALRAAVAEAAWRTDPLRSGSDGGFVVCLRVAAVAAADAVARHCGGGGDGGDVVAPCRWWTNPESRVVSAVTPAALEFVAALRSCGTAAASLLVHAGVPVGCLPATAATTATPRLPVGCRLSSATCHVDAAEALRAQLPRLTLSARAVCELLLLKTVDSRALRQRLRHLAKQSDLVSATAQDEEAETSAFLVAVEDAVTTHLGLSNPPASHATTRSGHTHMWVCVDAASLLPSPPALGALHPAVAEELEAAGVVVEVEYAVRAPAGSSPPCRLDVAVRLDVPSEMPERAKHLAALEQWRVALRDALLYVHRRTRGGESPPRLWASPPQSPSEATTVAGGGGGGDGDDDGALELAEDEYEAVSTARDSAHRVLESPNVPHFAAEDRREDWLRDTNYRQWRQRRAQR